MADKLSSKQFGKRRPPAEPPPRPPAKRSGHVALLVMGTIAVGTTAYTLMPRQHCEPAPAGTDPTVQTTCSSSSSRGPYGGSSRSSFFSSDSSSHSSSGTSSDSGHSSVSRGGFGSFGHGFSGGG